jgi:pyruvate/2-oxoglutarate dehydrogenase complex dihydrolipoamide acyltransferase (E2) component
LITVESDKASMEIPSRHGGVVKELKVKLGDKVAEGTLLVLEAAGDAAQPASAPASKANQPLAQVSPAQYAT